MTQNESISRRYRQANAENFQVIDWLISTGVCRDKVEAARYLSGPAGPYAIRSYRAR